MLRDFEGLSTKHRNAFSFFPKEQFDHELCLSHEVVKTGIEVIESAPQRLRVVKIVPVLKSVKTHSVEVVPAVRINEVVAKPVQNLSRAILKRAIPRRVSCLQVSDIQVVKPICYQFALELVPNAALFPVVKIAPFSTSQHVIIQKIECIKPVSSALIMKDLINYVKATTDCIQAYGKNFPSVSPCFDIISSDRGKVKSKTVRNNFSLEFVLNLDYCRLFMRCFWTYFMFADFMSDSD